MCPLGEKMAKIWLKLQENGEKKSQMAKVMAKEKYILARTLIGGCFVGLLFREHPKAQPGGGFRRSPGSNLRPLVYKASDLTTAPRRPGAFL